MQTNKDKTNKVKEGGWKRGPRPEYFWLFPVDGNLAFLGVLSYKAVKMMVQEEVRVLRLYFHLLKINRIWGNDLQGNHILIYAHKNRERETFH